MDPAIEIDEHGMDSADRLRSKSHMSASPRADDAQRAVQGYRREMGERANRPKAGSAARRFDDRLTVAHESSSLLRHRLPNAPTVTAQPPNSGPSSGTVPMIWGRAKIHVNPTPAQNKITAATGRAARVISAT